MQACSDADNAAPAVSLLRHTPAIDDAPAIACIVPAGPDSLALVLPRPVAINRSHCDVIRVTLASSLATVTWKDLDVVLVSDAACLLSLPWLLKNVSPLTRIVCSSGLLRLGAAFLSDVFSRQHVQFEVAGTLLNMFVTPAVLADCARLLCPAYRLSPLPLLGGGTLTAFCSGAEPGCLGWIVSRGDGNEEVVVSRQHSIQPSLAFGAADDVPAAPPAASRCRVTLAGVQEAAVIEAASAARAALAAGGCVLGIAACPFAISRFILLLKDTNVPVIWMGQNAEEVYDALHKLAEYCNDDLLRMAYDGQAPFVLQNALGEISIVAPQDVSSSRECVVVAACPSADFVTAWTFSKPTSNVVLRFV